MSGVRSGCFQILLGDIAASSDSMFSFFGVLDSFGFLQDNVVGEVSWSVSMMMVAIEDVVRADAMDAAGGAFNLFYLSAQCAH